MSSFFKIFHKKPPTVMPKLGQKTSILSKLHYFMGHESPQDTLFFLFFTKKLLPSCPRFIKYVYSQKKHTVVKPIFCEKTSRSLKNTVLLSLFLKFFMNNPLLSSPYWVKKMSILLNYSIFLVQKVDRMPFSIFRKKK